MFNKNTVLTSAYFFRGWRVYIYVYMDIMFNISQNKKKLKDLFVNRPIRPIRPTRPIRPPRHNSGWRPRRKGRALDPEGRLYGKGRQRKI